LTVRRDNHEDCILRLHQPVADGVAHQRGGRLEVQLAHRRRAVRLDGLDAQIENLANLLGNQLHDHALLRRERPLGLAVVGCKEGIEELLGNSSGEERLVFGKRLHGSDEILLGRPI
jgi:hypothetical protein